MTIHCAIDSGTHLLIKPGGIKHTFGRTEQNIERAIFKCFTLVCTRFGRRIVENTSKTNLRSFLSSKIMAPKRRFALVEKYVHQTFCKHFSYSKVLYLGLNFFKVLTKGLAHIFFDESKSSFGEHKNLRLASINLMYFSKG